MLLRIDSFKGMAPRVAPRGLPANAAQVATDCNLFSGEIRPWKGPVQDWAPSKVGVLNTIYHFAADTATPKWFHWLERVDVVRSPLSGITNEPTLFTVRGGTLAPQITDASLALTGGTTYPMASYDLGIPAPARVPVLTYTGTPNTDPANNETRSYVYTYVTAWGEEGPPSPPSAEVVVNLASTANVQVTGMSGLPVGVSRNITAKRIYRTATSAVGTEYQFVAEVAVAITSHTDTTVAASLGETLKTIDYDLPPVNLIGLTLMPNGVVAGFSGTEICFCEPYQPHAWPLKYRLHVEHPIMGIAAYGNSLAVITTSTPYIITMDTPANASMQKIEVSQGCISDRGIVDMGYAVVYPSPDGLVSIGMSNNGVVSGPIMTKTEWEKYNPSTLIGTMVDGVYVGFYDATLIGGGKGAILFNPNDPAAGIVELGLYSQAVFSDPVKDALFYVDTTTGNIMQWNADAAVAPAFTWRSKIFETPRAMSFGALRVAAAGYPVTVRLYADGALFQTINVADAGVFRLKPGRAQSWEIELSSQNPVHYVEVGETISDLGAR